MRRIFIGIGLCILSLATYAVAVQSNQPFNTNGISRVSLQGNERVLYFGSNLKNKATLLEMVPNGQVTQISELPLIKKSRFGALKYDLSGVQSDYDHIYVDEALTKCSKQQNLLKTFEGHLKHDGVLLLQVPDYNRGFVASALHETWLDLQDFVMTAPRYLSYTSKQYQRMLKKTGLEIDAEGRHVEQMHFSSKQALVDWLEQNWVYCRDMQPSDRQIFVNVFVNNYLQVSQQEHGQPIRWEQAYMDIRAVKV